LYYIELYFIIIIGRMKRPIAVQPTSVLVYPIMSWYISVYLGLKVVVFNVS